ncbi:MAG: MBL fold metallo-hydrolase [Thermoanaerobaculia bacterium]|nr:MBL fold metallo-hydrolase [Thermoanaerobaculia bacterium]
MNRTTLSRSFVSLVSLAFAGLGFAVWAWPERAASGLALDAVGTGGFATVRADLGGLFLGVALLAGAAAWRRRRLFAHAAELVLAAVALGRLVGWILAGRIGDDAASFAVELAAVAALHLGARGLEPEPGAAEPLSRRAKLALAAAGSAVLAGALALLHPTVEQKLFDGAARDLAAVVNTAPFEDDALRVALCGTSAPLPSASRAKACVAVFAGGKFWVVDTGPESTENLVLWGIPLARIGGVLLTHFHSDHIGDLGELQLQTWAGGRSEPLAVYGGRGVDQLVDGFNLAYRQDQGYRTEHHGEQVMPSAAWGLVARTIELDGEPTPAKDRSGLVYDDGTLRITALEVDHAPIEPAYAFRFDYKGRSVVVSGDLKNHPPLARGAAGADVLISEAIATRMTKSLGAAAKGAGRDNTAAVMHDIEDYHITPEEAARLANQAGVKLLVYYHLLPAPDGFLPRRLFSAGVRDVREGDWTIAEDGSLYTLPIGSREVAIGRIDR